MAVTLKTLICRKTLRNQFLHSDHNLNSATRVAHAFKTTHSVSIKALYTLQSNF